MLSSKLLLYSDMKLINWYLTVYLKMVCVIKNIVFEILYMMYYYCIHTILLILYFNIFPLQFKYWMFSGWSICSEVTFAANGLIIYFITAWGVVIQPSSHREEWGCCSFFVSSKARVIDKHRITGGQVTWLCIGGDANSC